jgi:hypothetical protein
VDKGGEPFILHPLRVMLRLSTAEERIVAVLHDLVEDTAATTHDLEREGFTETIIEAVLALTRQEGEPYEDFIRRVAKDTIACRVKRVDLEDNSDLSRIPAPTEKDLARVQKYHRASGLLDELCD